MTQVKEYGNTTTIISFKKMVKVIHKSFLDERGIYTFKLISNGCKLMEPNKALCSTKNSCNFIADVTKKTTIIKYEKLVFKFQRSYLSLVKVEPHVLGMAANGLDLHAEQSDEITSFSMFNRKGFEGTINMLAVISSKDRFSSLWKFDGEDDLVPIQKVYEIILMIDSIDNYFLVSYRKLRKKFVFATKEDLTIVEREDKNKIQYYVTKTSRIAKVDPKPYGVAPLQHAAEDEREDLDMIHLESLTNMSKLDCQQWLFIFIILSKASNILTIIGSVTGMTKADLVNISSTVERSGTMEFKEAHNLGVCTGRTKQYAEPQKVNIVVEKAIVTTNSNEDEQCI